MTHHIPLPKGLAMPHAMPLFQFVLRTRTRTRNKPEPNQNQRAVLKSLDRYLSGLWLGVVVDLVHHHHSVTREPMMDVKR